MNRAKIYFYSYLVLILIGSSIPSGSVPDVFRLTWDKLLHVLEYCILGILGFRYYSVSLRQPLFGIIIFGVTVGIIDEIYQSIIPGRFTSSIDEIADGIGVISGAFISKYSLISSWLASQI